MKKLLLPVLAILVANIVFSQVITRDNEWVNPCPTCLPGTSYGFEWPEITPPADPVPPGPPPTVRWTNDLSVTIVKIKGIQQKRDVPYFTIVYKITLTNING